MFLLLNIPFLFLVRHWLKPPLWFFPKDKNEKIDLTKDIRTTAEDQYNKADTILLKNFYEAITGQGKPICPACDAFQSLKAIEASRLACERKARVDIEPLVLMSA